jgi:hypothetical protein
MASQSAVDICHYQQRSIFSSLDHSQQVFRMCMCHGIAQSPLTLAPRVGIAWPDNLAIIFETIQAINFNPSVLQLECDNSGVNNDYQNFIIMMLVGISAGFV